MCFDSFRCDVSSERVQYPRHRVGTAGFPITRPRIFTLVVSIRDFARDASRERPRRTLLVRHGVYSDGSYRTNEKISSNSIIYACLCRCIMRIRTYFRMFRAIDSSSNDKGTLELFISLLYIDASAFRDFRTNAHFVLNFIESAHNAMTRA